MSFILNALIQAASNSASSGWDLNDFSFNGATANRWPQAVGTSEYYPSVDESSLVAFNNDGTKVFILPSPTSGPYLYAYNLSSAYNLTTAGSSFSARVNLSSQATQVVGIFFKPDGTKLYVADPIDDEVYEYNLSSAWDLDTASYNQNKDLSSQNTSVAGLWFKSDGTKMFVLNETNSNCEEWTLSSAWDVSTASYSTAFGDAQGGSFRGIAFNSSGTKLYRLDDNKIHESGLSSAWSLSSASYTDTLSITVTATQYRNFALVSGTSMYLPSSQGYVDKYTLSSSDDISTATWTAPTSDYYSLMSDLTAGAFSIINARGLFLKNEGDYFYCGDSGGDIHRFTMSTPFNLTTASKTQSNTNLSGTVSDLFFSPDGTKFFALIGTSLKSYTLSSAWDISSLGSATSLSVNSGVGLHFRPNGNSFYIMGGTNNRYIYTYDMSTAFDISTASLSSTKFISQTGFPTVPTFYGMTFDVDGTRMYAPFNRSGIGGNQWIAEFSMSQWNFSNLTKVRAINFGNVSGDITKVRFRPNGRNALVLTEQYQTSVALLTYSES